MVAGCWAELGQRLATWILGGLDLCDGVHHRLDAFPRLDARLQYLLRRQKKAVSPAVSQLDRVDVRNACHAGRPVTRVTR